MVALDLKEGGEVLDRLLDIVATMGLEDSSLWFNGAIEDLCEPGIRCLAEAHPVSTISVRAPSTSSVRCCWRRLPLPGRWVLDMVRSWGVNRLSLDWRLRMHVVSRQIERIGDNAVDIGEQVAFLVTGEFREFTDASHPESNNPSCPERGGSPT